MSNEQCSATPFGHNVLSKLSFVVPPSLAPPDVQEKLLGHLLRAALSRNNRTRPMSITHCSLIIAH